MKYFTNNKVYKNKILAEIFDSYEEKYKDCSVNYQWKNFVNFSTSAKAAYHQWLPYREGYSEQLIRFIIDEEQIPQNMCVVDPFCGSGTTLIAASGLGYANLGIDINPMSVFLSKAKLNMLNHEVIESAEPIELKLVVASEALKEKHSELKKYFDEWIYNDLIKLLTIVEITEEVGKKNLLQLAFICIIESCSNRKRDGNGLRSAVTKVKSVEKEFNNKLLEIKEDLLKDIGDKPNSVVVFDSAVNIEKVYSDNRNKVGKVGGIIFSPPYANSFDYFESYKIELLLGEFVGGVKELKDLRKKAIRSFVGARCGDCEIDTVNMLADEIERAVPEKEEKKGKADGRSRKVPDMIRGYFCDMEKTIKGCAQILEKGRFINIVVDRSAYLGKIVPTDLILCEIAETCGLSVVKIVECKKTRTSVQQQKDYPYMKGGLRSTVIKLKKE